MDRWFCNGNSWLADSFAVGQWRYVLFLLVRQAGHHQHRVRCHASQFELTNGRHISDTRTLISHRNFSSSSVSALYLPRTIKRLVPFIHSVIHSFGHFSPFRHPPTTTLHNSIMYPNAPGSVLSKSGDAESNWNANQQWSLLLDEEEAERRWILEKSERQQFRFNVFLRRIWCGKWLTRPKAGGGFICMFYAAGRYGESGRQFAFDLIPVGGWAIVICNGAGLQGLFATRQPIRYGKCPPGGDNNWIPI